jgi:hypothetical protein
MSEEKSNKVNLNEIKHSTPEVTKIVEKAMPLRQLPISLVQPQTMTTSQTPDNTSSQSVPAVPNSQPSANSTQNNPAT